MNLRVAVVSGVALAVVLGGAGRASADEPVAACVKAAERAQALRAEGKLKDARAELATCSRAECPDVVRRDCSQWMREVVDATATVVFGARDPGGHDLIATRVAVDGKVLVTSLDGRGIALDPGSHVVRMEAPGHAPAEEVVLVREGEKDRPITFTLSLASARQTPARAETPAAAARPERPVPPSVYVAGALGVTALGVAAYFDISATSEALALKDSCANRCQESQVDPLRTDYRIAQVSAAVGVVAVAVAAILFLTRPARPATTLRPMP